MAEIVERDGRKLRIIYFHARLPHSKNYFERLDEAILEALSRGQIKPYDYYNGTVPTFNEIIGACGFTTALIQTRGEDGAWENVENGIGFSFCSPNDQFNRRVGRSIARNRALRELGK
jgi:hypothetical protein